MATAISGARNLLASVRTRTLVRYSSTVVTALIFRLYVFVYYAACAVDTGNFYRLTTNNNPARNLIDKSLLIEEYLKCNSQMIVITRPPGWGKSTNMDMIKMFLEIDTNLTNNRPSVSRTDIYSGLKIANSSYSARHRSKFPVIHLTFDDVVGTTYSEIEKKLWRKMDSLFSHSFGYLRHYVDNATGNSSSRSDVKLPESTKEKLLAIYTGHYTKEILQESLRHLSILLYEHFDRRVHVLIDDYDTPINSVFLNMLKTCKVTRAKYQKPTIYEFAYTSPDFSETMRLFKRLFLLLRHTYAIEKVLISGILPLNENLFDLSDRFVFTVLDDRFTEFYGLTVAEVKQHLALNGESGEKANDEIELAKNRYCRYNDCDGETSRCSMSILDQATTKKIRYDQLIAALVDNIVEDNAEAVKSFTEKQRQIGKVYVKKLIEYKSILKDGLTDLLLFGGHLTIASNASANLIYGSTRLCRLGIVDFEKLSPIMSTH